MESLLPERSSEHIGQQRRLASTACRVDEQTRTRGLGALVGGTGASHQLVAVGEVVEKVPSGSNAIKWGKKIERAETVNLVPFDHELSDFGRGVCFLKRNGAVSRRPRTDLCV